MAAGGASAPSSHGVAVGIPFIVLVAAFRLYLGAHYLSDVIASTVFAAGTVLIAVAIAGPWLLRLRNREESTTAG